MRRVPLSTRLSCWFNVFNQPKIQQQEPTCGSGAGRDHRRFTEARCRGSNICITIRAPIVLFLKKRNHKEFFYSHAQHIFPEDAEAIKVVMHQPAAWKESRQPDRQRAACPPDIRVTPHSPRTSATSTLLGNVLLIARHASETFLDRVSESLRATRLITAASVRPLHTPCTRSTKPRSIHSGCLLLLLLLLFLGGQLDLSALNQDVEV